MSLKGRLTPLTRFWLFCFAEIQAFYRENLLPFFCPSPSVCLVNSFLQYIYIYIHRDIYSCAGSPELCSRGRLLSDDFVAVSFTIFAFVPAEGTTNEISISCIGPFRIGIWIQVLIQTHFPGPKPAPNPSQTTGDRRHIVQGPRTANDKANHCKPFSFQEKNQGILGIYSKKRYTNQRKLFK